MSMQAYLIREVEADYYSVVWAAEHPEQARICAGRDYFSYKEFQHVLELDVRHVPELDTLASVCDGPQEWDWNTCAAFMGCETEDDDIA